MDALLTLPWRPASRSEREQALLHELAAGGPPLCPEYGWDESSGPCAWQCCYCEAEAVTDVALDDPARHDESCLWRRAYALKEELDAATQT